MGRRVKTCCRYIFSLALPLSALAAESPPLASLYGAYEILGREAGADGEIYRAWVRLAIEGDTIEIDRCDNGIRTEASGRIVALPIAESQAVQFEFERNSRASTASCVYSSDFDNLPRFTCYTYPADRPAIAVPGTEAYFPIVWPVSLDYFDCH